MSGLLKNKAVVVVVLAILVAAFVWYGMFKGGETPTPTLTSESVAGADASNAELISTLNQLRSMTLSGSIFSDPTFQGLRDFSTQIVPEPIGRDNPFASLGVFAVPASAADNHASGLFAPTKKK